MASGQTWDSLSTPLTCLETVKKLGFPTMTPVQAACIPAFLSHKDVCVQACTGSGKTLSFVIPMIEMLVRRTTPPRNEKPLGKYDIGAMIISPTRELATQIIAVTEHFAKDYPQFKLMALIGGKDVKVSGIEFRGQGANMIVATPGMLLAMMHSVEEMNFRCLELLVLDEADRLLDMGFERTLNSILQKLPKQRRTGLFSATQTDQIKQLARAGLRNPVKIEVQVQHKKTEKKKKKKKKKKGAEEAQDEEAEEDVPTSVETSLIPQTLSNTFMMCEPALKMNRLIQFLLQHKTHKIIVFFLTCATVDYYSKVLENLECLSEHRITGMHGKQAMKKRTANFKTFASGSSGVLLCTDVAARGIDLPDVDWILQYDPPQDPDMFVHRIGRTARAERKGNALVFLLPKEDAYVEFLRGKKVPIVEYKPPELPEELLKIQDEIQAAAVADRDIMEKGQRGFVSFVRAYKEHHCAFIFVHTMLPYSELAKTWGLLFFPRMSDLKHLEIQFESIAGYRPCDIKFKDPQREKQRLKNWEVESKKRDKERAEREAKEKERRKQKAKAGPKRRVKRKHKEIKAEWDDLANEARMLKKLKAGKITQEEYDEATNAADEF